GGTLGDGAVTAMRFLFGKLGYGVPVALIGGGGLVLARELRAQLDDARAARSGEAGRRAGRRRARPMRTGILCTVAALTLALAAGRLGVGPGAVPGHSFWRSSAFESRGGIAGEAELWLASRHH